jgi:hypothetical protein
MAATGRYIHNARHTGLTIPLTSGYVAGSQRHQCNFWEASDSIKTSASPVRARISSIYIQVDTIAVGCTQLTIRVTRDAAGQQIIVPDTTATINTGITTNTAGGIVLKVDVDYKHSDSIAWMHFKTNSASCNVKSIDFVWEE